MHTAMRSNPTKGVLAMLSLMCMTALAAPGSASALEAADSEKDRSREGKESRAVAAATNAAAATDFYADERDWFKHLGDWFNGKWKTCNDWRNRAEFRFFKDDPALPRVLLIGDSISMRYTPGVQKALAGKANVHRIPANGGPTTRVLSNLPAILGSGRWDVINFNCGLHDICRQPKGDAAKPDMSAPRQVSPENYEKNLETIIGQLKETGATLVFVNTTPVPENSPWIRRDEDVVAYNVIATNVMARHNIPVTDLYSACKPRLKELFPENDVHPFDSKGGILGEVVAVEIAKSLEKRSNAQDKK